MSSLALLKKAGFTRFHHNLETSRSYFPNICTTHTYDRRIETLRASKEAGLETCSGGILGLGETPEQRVELAATLASEKVDSIPLNFLVPLAGTRLEARPPLKPLDIIRSIAMFRMMNPSAEIKVCAGREHVRELGAMIFYAGATGFMMGPLLTIRGREPADDLKMLEDLEIEGVNLPGGR
jgi:biotin synthase